MKKTKLLKPMWNLLLLLMAMLVPQRTWAMWEDSAGARHIVNAADFATFSSNVNGGIATTVSGNFKLDNDITLPSDWVAIGTDNSGKRFAGTFDGQGHTITFSGSSQGLFGCTDGATIQNVKLAGSISSGQDNTGSVVSTARGATKIYNVYSSVGITMTAAKSHIGGIAGQILQADGKTGEIKGCTYSGEMNLGSSTDSNGGIVGYCGLNANIEIENCFFSGSISSTGGNPRIGGILGYADDDGSTQNFKYIRNCFCDGTLSPSTGDYVGIFAGYPRGKVKDVITNNTYVSTASTNMAGNSTHTTAANNGCKKITISVTAGANGSVSQSYVNPNSTTATQLEVVATPNAHYHFGSWDDSGAQTHSVGLTANVSLKASFAIDQHIITVNVVSGQSSMGTVSGGGTYNYGTQQTIKATPKEHYHFVQWNDGITNASRTITVTEDKTYTATFAPDQYTITVKTNDSNMGTVSGGGTFDYNSKQTIKATPKEHYHFVQWNDGNTDASRTITVTGSATYTATFAIDQHTITVKANNSNYGTVTGGDTYDYGTQQTITATPKTGYHFVKWSDNNTDATRTITVTGDATYTATFEAHTYGEWITDVAATCTTAGTKHRVCTHAGCDAREDGTIAILPHTYTATTATTQYQKSEATCTEPAAYYYSCSACGHNEHNDEHSFTDGTALGHDMTHHPAVEASCVSGNEEYWTCSRDCCEGKYYKDENGSDVWGSLPTTAAILSHTCSVYDNGFGECEVCHTEVYQRANNAGSGFEIKNAGQLYYYADLFISGKTDEGFLLLNDIVVNDGTFDADGNFTPTGESSPKTPRTWTPLPDRHFSTSIDGFGYTISGLYCSGDQNVGLLVHSDRYIFNLGIINSYFYGNGGARVGGICVTNSGLISGCWTDCYVSGMCAGGICGANNGNIIDCYSKGSIKASSSAGGICGECSDRVVVARCFSTAEISGQNCFGGICGRGYSHYTPNIIYCYSSNDYIICEHYNNQFTNCEGGISTERFASGEIAYKLNTVVDIVNTVSTGTPWRQTLGVDALPVLRSHYFESKEVYNVPEYMCDGITVIREYSNNWEGSVASHAMTGHAHVEATCTTQGNEEYWTCSNVCCEGKYYKDENGSDVWGSLPIIAALGHQWGDDHTCAVCHHVADVAHTGTSGTCTWTIYENGHMIIEPTEGETGTLADWGRSLAPWLAHYSEIKSVEFRGEVIASTCLCMFEGCFNLTAIDFKGFKTTNVTNMDYMFHFCESLQSLDLRGFNTANVNSMVAMFDVCKSLQSLDLSSFNTANVEKFFMMFSHCYSLATLKLSNDFILSDGANKDFLFYEWGKSEGYEDKLSIYYIIDENIQESLLNEFESNVRDKVDFVPSAIVKDGVPFNYSMGGRGCEIPAKDLVFTRTFTPGKPATITLPFTVASDFVTNAKFYGFTSLEKNAETGKWEANMDRVRESIVMPYTPYMVLTEAESITFGNETQGVVFEKTPSELYNTTQGDWTFVATNEAKVWTAEDFGNGEVYYGFAAGNETTPEGKFVKVGAGASIDPLRAYIMKTPQAGGASNAPARVMAADQVPSTITVRLNEESSTGIGTLNTETGQFTFDGWYDLQGRRISEPVKGGISINNNKKIIVR